MNFSPTVLTSVETDKGKINVLAKKVDDDNYYIEVGYPKVRGRTFVSPRVSTVFIAGIEINEAAIEINENDLKKILQPIL